ncbi:hypothetical protein F1880_002792 [Penicillium rolfsii]|nr:hypothetical protein F1880_002792 [Penicillium rolfsii]
MKRGEEEDKPLRRCRGIILVLQRAIGSVLAYQLHGMTGLRILREESRKKNNTKDETECPA